MTHGGPLWLCVLVSAALACSKQDSPKSRATALPATRLPAGSSMRKGWDINGIIGTGQSLAVGAEGTPLRAVEPSYRNLKLDLGGRFSRRDDPSNPALALVPLREPIRPLTSRYPGPYPQNIYGETPHTAMASQITALFLQQSAGAGDYVTVHSVVGESGQAISVIGKGAVPNDDTGHAYAASLFETRAIARLAQVAGRSFGVAAVVLTHGETDAENAGYRQGLRELWQSYDADLRAITGQATPALLLLSQQSSCPLDVGSVASSALAALAASQAQPGEIVCVGPRYQYSYVADGVHLDALGYDRLGEKYGQVYFERVVQGRDWRPLSPLQVTRQADVISVQFRVPVPPLVWDETMPMPHAERTEWAAARGFELSSGERAVKIESVELSADSVHIRHAAAPGSRLVLRYAAVAGAAPRAAGARRWGQLRDSDPFVGSVTRTVQPNYAVSFELAVPEL